MEESLFREAKHSYLRIVGGIEPRLRPDFAFDGHKRSCASEWRHSDPRASCRRGRFLV